MALADQLSGAGKKWIAGVSDLRRLLRRTMSYWYSHLDVDILDGLASVDVDHANVQDCVVPIKTVRQEQDRLRGDTATYLGRHLPDPHEDLVSRVDSEHSMDLL